MQVPEESVVDGSKAPPGKLASVDRLLRQGAARRLLELHGRRLVAGEIRALRAAPHAAARRIAGGTALTGCGCPLDRGGA